VDFEFHQDVEAPSGCNGKIINLKSQPKKNKARDNFYLHLKKEVLEYLEAESGETLNIRFGYIQTRNNEEQEAFLIVAEQE
jgi:hypothetical protein